MVSDYSIVRQDRFIEATRDSGYKGTASALSELIDNSLQAQANSISIEFVSIDGEYAGAGRPAQPRVVEVAIADDGRGMDAETLRRSLRFGDSSRFGDRTGIGRFGMGLPNASVSQCRRVEVYSWRRGEKPLFTFIDVDMVTRGEMVEVPAPKTAAVPAPYEHLARSSSGTLVVWKKCEVDRMDHEGKAETLRRALKPTLGRMFRHFLVEGKTITIDREPVSPIDPLYLMPQTRRGEEPLATKHGDTLRFEVPIPGKPDQTSPVEVTFSLLPEEWQRRFGGSNPSKEQKEGLRARLIDSTEGFSMVRARREIDLIPSPYRSKHWLHRWYRVEVRFEPVLDELLGVTHTKQEARLARGSALSNMLEQTIRANEATLIDMIKERNKRVHVAKGHGPRAAESAAKKVDPQLKPVESLRTKSAADVDREIKAFLAERLAAGLSPEAAAELGRRLMDLPAVFELEQLPGAPLYRIRTVGRTIVVMLNTAHQFYERVYRRLEAESPMAKTGVDLLLMALARSEITGSEEAQEWYDSQRQDWSQNLKLFASQLPEYEGPDEAPNSAK